MKKNERTLIIAALVIALALGGYYYWYWKPAPQKSAYTKALPSLSAESRAKIPAGFPRYLILGENVSVTGGTITVDTPAEKVFHVTTLASGAPAALAQEYGDFLSHSGWKILSNAAHKSEVTITASRGFETATVVFTINDAETTKATITYAVRKP